MKSFFRFKSYKQGDSYYRIGSIIEGLYASLFNIFLADESKSWAEKPFLKKKKPFSTVYLNSFGIFLYSKLNILFFLFFRRFMDHDISLDEDVMIAIHPPVWPRQAMHYYEKASSNITSHNKDLLSSIYIATHKEYTESGGEDSQWWIDCRREFINYFFVDNKIKEKELLGFRSDVNTNANLLKDSTQVFSKSGNVIGNTMRAINLISLYHKYSRVVSIDILRMASESYVGGSRCVYYRGQRLSYRILRHAYYFSQIRKYCKYEKNSKIIIMDVGGGYGNLLRFFANYYTNGTFVLIDLPEVITFAAYFLSECFPKKKIGTELDIKEINDSVFEQFDFVLLTTTRLKDFKDNSIDIVTSTTSIGEMTTATQKTVYSNIERISKGYFYSNNRGEGGVSCYSKDFGFNSVNFKERWHSHLYQKSHTYHIETLMEKI